MIVAVLFLLFASKAPIAMNGSQEILPSDSVSQAGGSASASSHKAAPPSVATTKNYTTVGSMSAGGMLGAQTIQCKKCKLSKSLSMACKTHKNTCLKCASAYKSLSDRWQKHRGLKSWWHGLQEPEQVQWYRKNNEHENGTRRRFDDVDYMEQKKRVVGEGDIDEDWFQPWAVFLKEGLTAGSEQPNLEAQWQQLVESPDTEAVFKNGQWHVPAYQGFKRKRSDMQYSETGATRSKNVESAEELEELQQAGSKVLDATYLAMIPAKIAMDCSAPTVDTDPTQQPTTKSPAHPLANHLLREITAKVREEAHVMNLAAEDNLAAAAAAHSGKKRREIPVDPTVEASNLNIQKIKLLSTIDTQAQKIPEMLARAGDKKDRMIEQLEELVSKTPSIAESSHSLKSDVVTKFNQLSTYWTSISDEIVAEKGKVQAANSTDDIKTTGTNVSAIVKKFSQGTAKEFTALTRQVHSFYDREYRNYASALVAPDTAKSPLVLVLEKYIAEKR